MAAVRIQAAPRLSSIKIPTTKIMKATSPAPKAQAFEKAPEVAGISRPLSRFRAPKEMPTSVPPHWSNH